MDNLEPRLIFALSPEYWHKAMKFLDDMECLLSGKDPRLKLNTENDEKQKTDQAKTIQLLSAHDRPMLKQRVKCNGQAEIETDAGKIEDPAILEIIPYLEKCHRYQRHYQPETGQP